MCSTVLTPSTDSNSNMPSSVYDIRDSPAFMQPLIAPEEHSAKFLLAGAKYISSSSSSSSSASVEGQESSTIAYKSLSQLNELSMNNNDTVRLWWVYEKESDIGRLINWLGTK